MTDRNKKVIKFILYMLLFAYIIGGLVLVAYLRKQAQAEVISFTLANALFDTYIFSIGACLLIIMPFEIHRNTDRVTILSYIIFAVFLGLAIYFKYYTYKGEVVADLLYVFSGAMFYQAIKYTIKWIKYGKKPVEEIK